MALKKPPVQNSMQIISGVLSNISWLQWIKDVANHSHYVDRGDPSAWDFQVGDLTTDGTWRDLDLSGIISAAAKIVHARVSAKDDAVNSTFALREKGNSNEYNMSGIRTQVADLEIDLPDVIVKCDDSQVIQYNAENTTWTTIDFSVRGWWE